MARMKGGFIMTRKDPGAGEPWDFLDIVAQSGMKNVVTTNNPPRIRIHDGESDILVDRPGSPTYLLAHGGLPRDPTARAAAILRKLADVDWASGEIVGRHERDLERLRTGYGELEPRLTYELLKVRRFIRDNPEADLDAISEATGVSAEEILSSGEFTPNDGPLTSR